MTASDETVAGGPGEPEGCASAQPDQPSQFPGFEAALSALSEEERAVLDFGHLRWKYPGATEAVVLEQIGWSMTRHHQVLDALLDRPEALVYAPSLVARLRRSREQRREQRRPRAD